jgi:hypothetical protein
MKHVAREKKIVPPHPLDRFSTQVPADALAPRETPSLFEMQPQKKSFAEKTLPWVGWALAAGLLLPAVTFYQDREHLKSTVESDQRQLAQAKVQAELMDTMLGTARDPQAVHARLTSTGMPPPPQGRASYVAEKGALVFVASNLQPIDQYKTYELWVIPKGDGQDPIPAGTFKPDARGNASVMMPTLPKGVEAKAFAVTIEDDGGSKVPTAPIILQGAAA